MFKKKAKKYRPDRIQELIDNIRQNYDCENLSDKVAGLQKVADVGYIKGYRDAEEYYTNVIDNQQFKEAKMADFEFTKRPDPEIKYGILQQNSKKEIQEWLVYNMRKFLLNEMHIPVGNIAPHNKELENFCKDIYRELHDVGYAEGAEATEYDFAENEGL